VDELGLQDAPVWIRANVRETLWMAQQADEIQQTIDQRAALGTGEEGEDAEVIPLNSAFHRNPGRRAKRRQMVLEQRGHPQ
jgi:hypothetical protein